MVKRKKHRGERGFQKTFTQEHIQRVIDDLLNQDSQLDKWHSPQDAKYKDIRVPLLLNREQYELFRALMLHQGSTPSKFFRKAIGEELKRARLI